MTAKKTPAEIVERCQQIMAHAWMVRTFVKHSEEAEDFPELMGITRAVFDTSCALETRLEDIKGKAKYIDLTFEFPQQHVSCAVELKFKTAKQGAQDYGRIDAFVDIEALELACLQNSYDFGRFYMITDSKPYVRQSKRGVGTVFTTHDGASTSAEQRFHFAQCKGREDVKVQLSNPYKFHWEQHREWYFLELNVLKGTDISGVGASSHS